jgi:hypothetical protein
MYIYSIIIGAATVVISLTASSVISCLGNMKILGMFIYIKMKATRH